MKQLLAQVESGQKIDLTPKGTGLTQLSGITITGLISTAITLILIVAGLIFFFMLIIGGVKWILSGGDKAQTESARNQITAALIGLVVVFAAWAIAKLIAGIFGVDILNFTTPNVA